MGLAPQRSTQPRTAEAARRRLSGWIQVPRRLRRMGPQSHRLSQRQRQGKAEPLTWQGVQAHDSAGCPPPCRFAQWEGRAWRGRSPDPSPGSQARCRPSAGYQRPRPQSWLAPRRQRGRRGRRPRGAAWGPAGTTRQTGRPPGFHRDGLGLAGRMSARPWPLPSTEPGPRRVPTHWGAACQEASPRTQAPVGARRRALRSRRPATPGMAGQPPGTDARTAAGVEAGSAVPPVPDRVRRGQECRWRSAQAPPEGCAGSGWRRRPGRGRPRRHPRLPQGAGAPIAAPRRQVAGTRRRRSARRPLRVTPSAGRPRARDRPEDPDRRAPPPVQPHPAPGPEVPQGPVSGRKGPPHP